uniref:Transmembrane protein 106 C-terminal domain-containing protein n=1 Tax=Electrophorus electricus TaxID=8005 RepID=A0A4W4DRJ4_ELEEL
MLGSLSSVSAALSSVTAQQEDERKLYVGLSVIMCLLVSSLVAFFLFPRPVLVEDGGVQSVIVLFDHERSRVLINMTVSASLIFHNGNFFTMLVDSVSGQVLYMKTIIGTQQLDGVLSIQPLSQRQVPRHAHAEAGHPGCSLNKPMHMTEGMLHFPYRTSVKTSYMVRSAQYTLEAYRYIDCGANSTLHHPSSILLPWQG